MNYKIDWKKWKAAEEAILADRPAYEKRRADYYANRITWKEYSDLGGSRDHAAELTKLYSIRAHGRGKLHRAKATWTHFEYMKAKPHMTNPPDLSYVEFQAANGRLTLDLDIAYQAKYIGDAWKQYAKETE